MAHFRPELAPRVARWELEGVGGAVVVIDVIWAFSTAAYACGSGAAAIYLVDGVEDALRFVESHPDAIAVGEDHGRRPDGFHFPNSLRRCNEPASPVPARAASRAVLIRLRRVRLATLAA